MQTGFQLPAPARPLAMALRGQHGSTRMTADNHDPFALGGGGHDGNTEGPTLEECAAIEFAPLSEDDRRAMYESLGKSKWNESARTLGIRQSGCSNTRSVNSKIGSESAQHI